MTSFNQTSKQLAEDLRAAGLRPGGAVLVHSSVRALGPFEGGLEAIISGLLEAVGPDGTLLLPALSYLSVNPSQTVFHLRQTPVNVGALPEYFRSRPGTARSLHPTHSVCAVGPLAGELLGGHHLDHTPCGEHSPFRRLRDLDGQVLFLGCGMRPNTSMHGVEELAEPPYLFASESTYQCHPASGDPISFTMRNHNFEGFEQRYDRLADLLTPDELHCGQALAAQVQIVECRAMWAKGLQALERDPLFFVARRA